ncbi:MAG: ATP-binding protein [Chloroflexi bacterium]|nr:ATP-binding protein [Chloroflexota bacterium]
MNVDEIAAVIHIGLAAVIMLLAAIATTKILSVVGDSKYVRGWRLFIALMTVFYVVYVAVLSGVLAGVTDGLVVLTGVGFFVGALATYVAVRLGSLTIADLTETTVSKAYTENIIRSMMHTLIALSPDLRIETANQSACSLLGYTEEEIIGMPMATICPLEELFGVTGTEDLIRAGPISSVERTYCAKDGSKIPVLFAGSITTDNASGGMRSIVCVAGDITERKRAEEALVEKSAALARSNAELNQFAYVASHDLQAPLRSVVSFLQLLESRYKDKLDSDGERFITRAVDAGGRMRTLIHDLLSYARLQTQARPFEPCDLSALLDRVLGNLQITLEETGAVVTHDSLPSVTGDDTQLEQLFQNLIGNAIKFRDGQAPRIHIGVAPSDRDWLFSIRDNGIGMEPKYAERIFLIFQRLHGRAEYPGTGIGLAIAKNVVERHGGTIWVESELGEGSTFYFRIRGQEETNATG